MWAGSDYTPRLVHIHLEMTRVSAPIVGIIARDPTGLQRDFALPKHVRCAPSKDIRPDRARAGIAGVPQPALLLFLANIRPVLRKNCSILILSAPYDWYQTDHLSCFASLPYRIDEPGTSNFSVFRDHRHRPNLAIITVTCARKLFDCICNDFQDASDRGKAHI